MLNSNRIVPGINIHCCFYSMFVLFVIVLFIQVFDRLSSPIESVMILYTRCFFFKTVAKFGVRDEYCHAAIVL